jgi:molybdopterin synthase sulfur carrier subunit
MEILLFGAAREIIGERKLVVDANENISSVGHLKNWMKEKYPAFSTLTSFAVAVDNEYAEDNQQLTAINEVALIPPVSGG